MQISILDEGLRSPHRTPQLVFQASYCKPWANRQNQEIKCLTNVVRAVWIGRFPAKSTIVSESSQCAWPGAPVLDFQTRESTNLNHATSTIPISRNALSGLLHRRLGNLTRRPACRPGHQPVRLAHQAVVERLLCSTLVEVHGLPLIHDKTVDEWGTAGSWLHHDRATCRRVGVRAIPPFHDKTVKGWGTLTELLYQGWATCPRFGSRR